MSYRETHLDAWVLLLRIRHFCLQKESPVCDVYCSTPRVQTLQQWWPVCTQHEEFVALHFATTKKEKVATNLGHVELCRLYLCWCCKLMPKMQCARRSLRFPVLESARLSEKCLLQALLVQWLERKSYVGPWLFLLTGVA